MGKKRKQPIGRDILSLRTREVSRTLKKSLVNLPTWNPEEGHDGRQVFTAPKTGFITVGENARRLKLQQEEEMTSKKLSENFKELDESVQLLQESTTSKSSNWSKNIASILEERDVGSVEWLGSMEKLVVERAPWLITSYREHGGKVLTPTGGMDTMVKTTSYSTTSMDPGGNSNTVSESSTDGLLRSRPREVTDSLPPDVLSSLAIFTPVNVTQGWGTWDNSSDESTSSSDSGKPGGKWGEAELEYETHEVLSGMKGGFFEKFN